MAEVLVRDETMSGREIEAWVLADLPDEITARELLRLRVRDQVARFNSGSAAAFRGLVGRVQPGPAKLEWVEQADVACAAFAGNAFIMLAGDHQIDDLDELIDLRRDTAVAFIRLVPLVGG